MCFQKFTLICVLGKKIFETGLRMVVTQGSELKK